MMTKDLTWNKILTGYSEKLLKFVLNANLLTLATPDNLRRWNVSKEAACGLCMRPNVGLGHVLAGCPWVLKVENKLPREDRNTWRHNCVLLEFSIFCQQKLKEVNQSQIRKPSQFINFVGAGQVPKRIVHLKDFGVLAAARDWISDFDLPDLHSEAVFLVTLKLRILVVMVILFLIQRKSASLLNLLALWRKILSIGTN